MTRSPPASVLLAAVAIATVLAYWPGVHGGFVLDDYVFIVTNPDVHMHALTWQQLRSAMHSAHDTPLLRPLSYLSFAINYYFTGLDPFWMKLTNVVIHVGNGLLLFGLLRAMLGISRCGSLFDNRGRDALALLVAAAWLLAPINLSAVLYVYQRAESIANLFVFGGLWMYVAGRRRQLEDIDGGAWRIGAGVLGGSALGILFKEDAALLPLYALLLEVIMFGFLAARRGRSRGLIAFYVAIVLIPAIAGGIGILHWALGSAPWTTRDFTLPQRLLTEARVVVDYAHWTLLPTLKELSFYHDDIEISHGLLNPPWTLAAIVVLAGAVASIFALRRGRPLVALGIAWFLAGQVMTGTVIPLELVFEHRNYFASAGLLLALFGLVMPSAQSPAVPKARLLILVLLVCLYGGTTALRAADWSNPLRQAYAQTRKNPESPRARFELGYVLVGHAQQDPRLLSAGMDSLEQAARMPGSSTLPEEALIYAASKARLPVDAEWWRSLSYKLDHQAFSAEDMVALYTLTRCTIDRICAPSQQQMVPIYLQVIQKNPRNPQLMILYANYATSVLGDLPLARNLVVSAIALDPHNQNYQSSLRAIDMKLGKSGTPKPADTPAKSGDKANRQ